VILEANADEFQEALSTFKILSEFSLEEVRKDHSSFHSKYFLVSCAVFTEKKKESYQLTFFIVKMPALKVVLLHLEQCCRL